MEIRIADDWWRWAHATLISEAKVNWSAIIILTVSFDGHNKNSHLRRARCTMASHPMATEVMLETWSRE